MEFAVNVLAGTVVFFGGMLAGVATYRRMGHFMFLTMADGCEFQYFVIPIKRKKGAGCPSDSPIPDPEQHTHWYDENCSFTSRYCVKGTRKAIQTLSASNRRFE